MRSLPVPRLLSTRVICVAVVTSLGLAACSSSPQGSGASSGATLVADSVLIGSPSALPPGDPDQAAVAVADQVAAGGTARLPALLAAIRASGLGVRDLAVGGKVVVQPAEPNQNLAFQAGEVYGMARLLDRGYALSLTDLGELIRSFDPTLLATAPIADMLVDGIRTAADGTVPTKRFWGRFLVELGNKAAQPYDLMTSAPGTAQLNVVQVLFVMLGVFGDLSHEIAPLVKATPAPTTSSPTAVHNADAAKPLCSPGEREAEILDVVYTGTSFGFEKLIDFIAEHLPGEALSKFSAAIPWMNAALATIRFIVTALVFDAKLELSGGEPLVRTKDTAAGQQRDLTVSVKINTGKSTFVNCMRLLLNGVGLDFSLPEDGPVDGAEITWTLLSGNESVRLCALPCGSGGTGDNNARTGKTEASGELKLGVEGKPQPQKLPDTVTPVTHRAVVRAAVNLKPAKMFRDLMDAAQTVIIGLPAGLVTVPLELLTRVGAFGTGLGFNVTDWGERWKIAVTLHGVGQNASGEVDWNWLGTVDVSADGVVTGEGTGLVSGRPACEGGSGATTASGGYGVVFGGTKKGGRFDLSVKGVAPSIQVGSFGADCEFQHQPEVDLLTSIATDPAMYLGGFDVFSFDAAAGGQFSGATGLATAVLTIKATQEN